MKWSNGSRSLPSQWQCPPPSLRLSTTLQLNRNSKACASLPKIVQFHVTSVGLQECHWIMRWMTETVIQTKKKILVPMKKIPSGVMMMIAPPLMMKQNLMRTQMGNPVLMETPKKPRTHSTKSETQSIEKSHKKKLQTKVHNSLMKTPLMKQKMMAHLRLRETTLQSQEGHPGSANPLQIHSLP